LDFSCFARSVHNLVVEAVDLRLDTTAPLARPVIYPAVHLLLGRLQVTAVDDWQDGACAAATPMKSGSDSESTDVLMSIAKHSVTTKDRRHC
jgi:hypothetical protein